MTGNDNNDDSGGSRRATAAADGMVWAVFRWPEVAEMGIKQRNGNNVGMINRNFYLVKLLRGFTFNHTLQHSPFTSVFCIFGISLASVIIPSGLWQASYCMYQRRSYVVCSCLDRNPEVISQDQIEVLAK
jgi:hypothetical protein